MADYTYDGGYRAPVPNTVVKAAPLTNVAGAAASLALVVAVGVWSYGVLSRDVSGVPVVQAATGPMRIAPEEPGGTLADHQGLSVNVVAGLGAAEGPADQLLLAPVPAGLAAEDVASGAMIPVAPATPVSLAGVGPETGSTGGLARAGGETVSGQSEADQILALAAQIAAESEPLLPLSPLEPAQDAPVITSVSGLSPEDTPVVPTDGSDLLEGGGAAPDLPRPGPGLARSLRPQQRPGGLQVASMGPAEAAAAVAAASATREIDASTLPAGTRLVQIGAFDSPQTARVEWNRLEARFGDFLEGKGRVIQQAQSGGRTFYRLRAEGFVDLADARRFCAAFVADKVDCIPVVTK